MHKEYAVEVIESLRHEPKVWVEWAGEYKNSIRFIAIQLVRAFNLRQKLDVEMLRAIYARYGVDFDFSEQASKADAYFQEYRKNNPDLCHVTLNAAKVLAGKVEAEGLEAFIDCLSGELDAPWQWASAKPTVAPTSPGSPVLVSRDRVCAVPTLGGILSDLGVEGLSRRFPDAVLLPVSETVANAWRSNKSCSFVVVSLDGRGVALAPEEAAALGLTEVPNWLPDLTGVPCVPTRADFSKIGL